MSSRIIITTYLIKHEWSMSYSLMNFLRILKKKFSFFCFLVIFVLSLTTLIFMQNCRFSSDHSELQGAESLHFGILNTYLKSDQTKAPSNHFNLNEEIILQFEDADLDVTGFEWEILRGFTPIVQETLTNTSQYEISFDQAGHYEISSQSYGANLSQLGFASKWLSIGQCGNHILEIELIQGSLMAGGQASFQLKNASSLTNITWKVDSGEPISHPTIDISLASKVAGDVIFLEVVANPQNDCASYRRKILEVKSKTQPYFNVVRPVDQVYPVILENNNIYKYTKMNQRSLLIHVSDANRCEWTNDESDTVSLVSCNDGLTDIYLDQEKCDDFQKTLTAFYNESKIEKSVQKQYYNYCPKNHAFCYFGPIKYRPKAHHCSSNGGQLPFTNQSHRTLSATSSTSTTSTSSSSTITTTSTTSTTTTTTS